VIAGESKRFRLLHGDTHAQTAPKGDLVPGDDDESRSSHGTAGIIRRVSLRRKVERAPGAMDRGSHRTFSLYHPERLL
jgi:hypothetical protein